MCQCGPTRRCIVEGCDRAAPSLTNLCPGHLRRLERTGSTRPDIPLGSRSSRPRLALTPRRREYGRTYWTWKGIWHRCTNPNYVYYHRYGGRGITVCDRWRSFDNFYVDMGDKPVGLTLERIDNDGNYEPDNCKWATWEVQANNKTHAPLREFCRRGHLLAEYAYIRPDGLGRFCGACQRLRARKAVSR